jgi:hypothetical protein
VNSATENLSPVIFSSKCYSRYGRGRKSHDQRQKLGDARHAGQNRPSFLTVVQTPQGCDIIVRYEVCTGQVRERERILRPKEENPQDCLQDT